MKKKKADTLSPTVAAGSPSKDDLTARICWYHFREGQTQQEVADRVGLSRVTINKIISDAFKQGYVHISINTPQSACLELETQLRKTFGLTEVVVVPSPADESDVRKIVGFATGDYISKNLNPGQTLGLSWGGTIFSAAQALVPRVNAGNVVVSLSGGLHRSTVINPYDNASAFARILDANCYYITAPMFAEDKKMRDALMASEPIKAVLAVARKIDVALLTATDLTPKTWIIKHGALSHAMLKSLSAAGAVGSVCDQYLDAEGRVLDHEINRRTVSVPIDLIRKVPTVVLAAGGTYKVPIIRSIIKADLIDTLITDEKAAELLVQRPK